MNKKLLLIKRILLFDAFLTAILIFVVIYKNNYYNYFLDKDKTGVGYGEILYSLPPLSHEYIETIDNKKYDNIYENEVLNKTNSEDYKIINLTIGDIPAYLAVIYDPSKILLMTCKEFNTPDNSGRETIIEMSERYKAVVAVNGGRFYDDAQTGYDIPKGYIIKEGNILWQDNNYKADLIGFDYNNHLKLLHVTGEDAINLGIKDAMEFGPFLIVNGESKKVDSVNRASRTVIGQRKDGIVLFLITEGTTNRGITLEEALEIMKKYGAVNAANLDGGPSSSLVVNLSLIHI